MIPYSKGFGLIQDAENVSSKYNSIRYMSIITKDTQTGIPSGLPEGAICVQRFDDSQVAIHITFRISLRSSSMREPRDPLLKVIFHY
ncbi:14345_t:CDS:2 [Funneliformis caledonium]|uniref:14345_t:CDS:1 n=1 Tax=Funneliformis caledonium TaxID=1117310 RepID=A0A9N8ZLD5_9GLOM|nr:14345_t:CDS:2 [Funneliformis caledonium]